MNIYATLGSKVYKFLNIVHTLKFFGAPGIGKLQLSKHGFTPTSANAAMPKNMCICTLDVPYADTYV